MEKGLVTALRDKYPTLFHTEDGSETRIRILEDNMHHESIADFVITFGGDGLLLHLNTLFPNRNVPPVMSFDLGSLGFLCPFAYENFFDEVNPLCCDPSELTKRLTMSRLMLYYGINRLF